MSRGSRTKAGMVVKRAPSLTPAAEGAEGGEAAEAGDEAEGEGGPRGAGGGRPRSASGGRWRGWSGVSSSRAAGLVWVRSRVRASAAMASRGCRGGGGHGGLRWGVWFGGRGIRGVGGGVARVGGGACGGGWGAWGQRQERRLRSRPAGPRAPGSADRPPGSRFRPPVGPGGGGGGREGGIEGRGALGGSCPGPSGRGRPSARVPPERALQAPRSGRCPLRVRVGLGGGAGVRACRRRVGSYERRASDTAATGEPPLERPARAPSPGSGRPPPGRPLHGRPRSGRCPLRVRERREAVRKCGPVCAVSCSSPHARTGSAARWTVLPGPRARAAADRPPGGRFTAARGRAAALFACGWAGRRCGSAGL